MTEKQTMVYDYVMKHSNAHYIKNQSVFTAYITLGYDFQHYGDSEWEAKDTLAKCLSFENDVQIMVEKLLNHAKEGV